MLLLSSAFLLKKIQLLEWLDLDQDRQVRSRSGPDLGLNCLQRLSEDNKSHVQFIGNSSANSVKSDFGCTLWGYFDRVHTGLKST